ncbi:hypothetical protein K469DRAFT_528621, partial [Zopfia rhizophila CBS 207.26]
LQSRIDWDDAPLMAAYYARLKDRVKNKLARRDRPDNLYALMESAVRIDNRQYERELERKKGQ